MEPRVQSGGMIFAHYIIYQFSASTLQFSHFLLRTMQMLPNFTKDYFLVIDDFVPFVLALFESRTNDCILRKFP